MDQGGEVWNSNQLWKVASTALYAMEPTGYDTASKNGNADWPNGTFGAIVRCLLYSAGPSAMFWHAALVHDLYLKTRLCHKALRHPPYEACAGNTPPLARLRTFGAPVTAQKPRKRPEKAGCHTAHGVFIGYDTTPKHVCYFNLMKNRENLSTHHIIDEAHYGNTIHPPGPHIIMDMGYDPPPLIPAIITPPSLSRYPLRPLHKPVMPLYRKILPLPINKFMSAPVAVVATLSTSDIDCNNSVTITFSTYPIGPPFPKTILFSSIHPTLGLDL
jgi:hypothetical protein